jgi:biotin synthase
VCSSDLDSAKSNFEKFIFDSISKKIINFGISENELNNIIEEGEAFRTKGCLANDGTIACNRPFANSLPGPNLRNYPFKPNSEDIKLIKEQIKSQNISINK